MTKGYKKCFNENRDGFVLVELEIPDNATWFTPKLEYNLENVAIIFKNNENNPPKSRSDKAIVIKIHGGCTKARSIGDPEFTYEVGKEVKPTEPFDPVGDYACSSGIHFFLNKQHAITYSTGCDWSKRGNKGLVTGYLRDEDHIQITDAIVDDETPAEQTGTPAA